MPELSFSVIFLPVPCYILYVVISGDIIKSHKSSQSRETSGPKTSKYFWIPAFAGMTNKNGLELL